MNKAQLYLLVHLAMMVCVGSVLGGDRRGPSPLEKPIPDGIAIIANQPNVVMSLPFFEDFDSGLGAWGVDGFWHIPANPQTVRVLSPAIHPDLVILPEPAGMAYIPTPVSGNGMAWFGEDTTGSFIGKDFHTIPQDPLNGGTSTQTQEGALISPAIDLTSTSNAILEFDTWWEIEGVDVDAYDLMHVEISTDGGVNFMPIGSGLLNPLNDVDGEEWKSYSSGGLGMPGIWIHQLFDLTPFVGNNVHLRFRFDSGDELYNGFRGWFIDDVSVTGNALPAPSIANIDPNVSAPGEIVEITGMNFANGASIDVGGNPPLSSIISSNWAQIEVPFLPPGQYDVTVTNPDGQFDTEVNGLTITSDLPPVLSDIDPDSALAGTSISVTLFGDNFTSGANATIGGIPLSNISVVNQNTITGDSPSSLTVGTHNVRVTNPDGQFDQLISAFTVYSTVGIGDGHPHQPDGFYLAQNYPNPFNPSTRIEFQLRDAAPVKLAVFNLAGQEVTTLLNEYRSAGQYSVEFNAGDFPSGIYFYRLTAGEYSAMKKMILMK